MTSKTPEQAARSALRHIASAQTALATIASDDAVVRTSLELARAALAHTTAVVESIAKRVSKKRSEMHEKARIYLAIIRDANNMKYALPAEVHKLLQNHLSISAQDVDEIGEILKADLREKNASYPAYGTINDRLQKMGRDNPQGV